MSITMLDETKGEVKEAIIFNNPYTSVTLEEIIGALPNATIHFPYGHTSEDLVRLSEIKAQLAIGTQAKFMDAFLLMVAETPKILDIFTFDQEHVRDELRGLEKASKDPNTAGKLPIPYEVLSRIYSEFESNKSFREFVNVYISYYASTQMRGPRGSINFIRGLQEKYGDRLRAFPVNDIIGGFARDMLMPGYSNGAKVIIQGKPWMADSLAFQRTQEDGSARVALNPYWKGKYDIVPASDVNLEYLEGGDLRVAGKTLFVGQNTWRINRGVGYTAFQIEEELLRISSKERVVVIGGDIPILLPTHLDMYFTPFDERAVAVGDITPVAKYLESTRQIRPQHRDGHKKKQPYLDEVSRRLGKSGFEVARIPLYLESSPQDYVDGRILGIPALRSFANDVRNGKDALVATFNVPKLDEMGYRIFDRHGFTVRGIGGTGSLDTLLKNGTVYDVFRTGNVRCMIDVIARG